MGPADLRSTIGRVHFRGNIPPVSSSLHPESSLDRPTRGVGARCNLTAIDVRGEEFRIYLRPESRII